MVKNSLYNVSYKILNMAFPLIMASYAGHIILSTGIGKVATAQNVAQYFVLIAALGIPEYGTREIAKKRENTEERNRIFSELFFINLVSTVVCTIGYMYFIYTQSYFGDKRLYVATGISICLNSINVDWLYQGEENYKYITIRSFIVKIVSLIFLFLFVRTEEDYVKYALINIVTTAGNNIFNIINLKRLKVKLCFKGIRVKKHLKPVFFLLCTTVSIELYTLLDITMLSLFCEEENVGFYTLALKIPRMIIIAVTGLSGVLLPRLTRYYGAGEKQKCNSIIRRMCGILFYLFLPAGLGLIIVAPECVKVLFGESFIPGIPTLRIAALLIFALGFSNLFGTQLLLITNNEKKLFACTIIGAITNMCLNAVLIPIFEQNGAAAASVVSETCVTIMTVIFSGKYFDYGIDKKTIIDTSVAGILMAIVCIVVRAVLNYKLGNDVCSLVITIMSGITIYLFTSILLNNPILIYLKNIKKE